tara:strand:- start:128 stop:421 length:294 start_codon:yes stop_codon:yes gene_type:complete
MTVTNNQLAIQRTKLANQRTYLAYMRTGFGIASIAGALKKMWIAAFGIVMIIGSVIQYSLINSKLSSKQDSNNSTLDMIPMIYVVLSIGTLYLQWNT